MLHNSLRELGYDQRLQQANSEISNSKEGLAYIISQTTQAAEHVLQTVENIRPIQDNLSENATTLSEQWQHFIEQHSAFTHQPDLKALIDQTLNFLHATPEQIAHTQIQLTEIMLAQEFHDLTSQVVNKITYAIKTVEQEMLQLLIEDTTATKSTTATSQNELINGPVTNPEKQKDNFSSQDQVDSLLTELGF